jgi:hypothetical protein
LLPLEQSVDSDSHLAQTKLAAAREQKLPADWPVPQPAVKPVGLALLSPDLAIAMVPVVVALPSAPQPEPAFAAQPD